ncbi:hypothetical protein NVIE_008460 [Nitrososphaera viennensis EN76]|uniref:Uncharacterized protein n=1 Tax=Nitrososphaera viennensis EN76 TaxID=926571 RepID=A0A060HID3_9ARCH|nr:hypothetical protein NVIE_008460 [Nitrososphaera viennensis EN76]
MTRNQQPAQWLKSADVMKMFLEKLQKSILKDSQHLIR